MGNNCVKVPDLYNALNLFVHEGNRYIRAGFVNAKFVASDIEGDIPKGNSEHAPSRMLFFFGYKEPNKGRCYSEGRSGSHLNKILLSSSSITHDVNVFVDPIHVQPYLIRSALTMENIFSEKNPNQETGPNY